jgi:ribonuclease HII
MGKIEDLHKFDSNYKGVVAGVDEAGRGPWAGPVVAAAVILDYSRFEMLAGVDDSKKLPEKKREELFDKIIQNAVSYSISEVSSVLIDESNILAATLDAMKRSIEKLSAAPQIILVDGISRPAVETGEIVTIIDGDAKSLSIAAASILAKVHRDRIMRAYDSVYPGYGFGSHKGYGTAAHAAAMKKMGVCPIHRMSFKPVRKVREGNS